MRADEDEGLALVGRPYGLQAFYGLQARLRAIVAAVDHHDLAAQVPGGYHAAADSVALVYVVPSDVFGEEGEGKPHERQRK